MPGAGLVHHLRFRPRAGGAVAAALPGASGGHGYIRPADPFSASDHGLRFGRRRPVPLYVRAVARPFSLGEKVAGVAGRMRESARTKAHYARTLTPYPSPVGEGGESKVPDRAPKHDYDGERQQA